MEEKIKEYLTVWNIVLLAMMVVTVLSLVFSGKIYGEGSVFNGAPTGNPAVDGIYQMIPSFIDCIRIVFLLYVAAKLLQYAMTKLLSRNNKGKTAVKLINSFIKYFVAIIAVLSILSAIGVDTTTLVASAGIVGLVVGLGAQSLIADVVAGLFTVFEGEYQVGTSWSSTDGEGRSRRSVYAPPG